ncbi:MAG: peptidylprolyl isomerase [Arenicellales bacterium]|nr:peptidylprolyl isomerase [Arenicellales bacterium]
MFKRLIKEPLLHFLLLGVVLFFLFYQVADPNLDSPERIIVTQADVQRLKGQWHRQWRRPPTPQELDSLVESYIRETILYREALALGLDQDDVIVRRRMGQKLEFMFKDLVEQIAPTEAELAEFYQTKSDRYTQPGRYSFTHVYFSRDQRGADVENDARSLLHKLQTEPDTVDLVETSDRFLYQYQFDNQSSDQISRIFGRVFADNLAGLETGRWQGPVESGYGLHLVFIDERTEPSHPDLADIRDKVRWDLLSERQKEMDAAFYTELRKKYKVKIESSDGSLKDLTEKSNQ